MPSGPAKRPLWKRLLFASVLVLFVYGGIELCAFGAYRAWSGEWFSFSELREQQRQAAADGQTDTQDAPLASGLGVVLHPYLGFTFDPSTQIGAVAFNEHGFVGADGPIVEREPNTVVIGIFGGSVAEIFFKFGARPLAAELRKHPALSNKRIRFLCFGTGGYKQPQQLLTLGYVLGLGGELDVAINLDGFNEVALAATENVPAGVYPFFPRGWGVLAADRFGPAMLRMLGAVEAARAERRSAAQWIGQSVVGYSVLANLLWAVGDRRLANTVMTARTSLQRSEDGARPFFQSGPPAVFESDDELYSELTRVWAQCSLQMERLCRGNGVRYFHFLQPNQYVEGSKPLSDEEQRVAYDSASHYRQPVVLGYPKLRERGAEIRSAGVEFRDLTGVFEGVDESLYFDSCCHFNERGNAILAAAIAQVIAPAFGGEEVALGGEVVALSSQPSELAFGQPLAQRKLAIRAEYAGGRSRDVTYAGTRFTSGDSNVATVSEWGVVEALRPGTVEITVAHGGKSVRVPVRVEFPVVAAIGRGVRRAGAPRLRVSTRGDSIVFELTDVTADATATLVGALAPARSQLCDAAMFVPMVGSVQVPFPADGVRGEFVYEPPASFRGKTSYWQAIVQDARGPCGWWTSDALAVTVE